MKSRWVFLVIPGMAIVLLTLPGIADQVTSKSTAIPTAAVPTLATKFGDVAIFPADNPWNQNISKLKLHANSDVWLESVGLDVPLHADFGTVWNGAPNGIPYVIASPQQAKTKIPLEIAEESDPGPYPIPDDPIIEGGPQAPADSDRHLLMVDPHGKKLYELYQVNPAPGGGWKAVSGAIFDLTTNQQRPAGWTSADASGLPIFPGLARYDEIVDQGELRHALRFTVKKTQRAYIQPANHFASRSTDPKLPPMGMRSAQSAIPRPQVRLSSSIPWSRLRAVSHATPRTARRMHAC